MALAWLGGWPPSRVATAQESSASEEAPPVVSLERRPYQIRAWVTVQPDTRLDARGRAAAVDAWRRYVRRFVGVPWSLEVADDPGPMPTTPLESLVPEVVASAAAGKDKAWVIRVERNGGGYVLTGRALDLVAGRLGPISRREAPYPDDLARDLMALSLELFTPFAEVGATFPGGVELTVQGAALPAATAIGQVVAPGSIVRPLRIGLTEEGDVTRIQDIPYSYLRVVAVEGGRARCEIRSGIRDPLTKAVLGRFKLVALGVKPSRTPTRLRFLTDAVDRRPAAGYTVIARTIPDGPPRDVGFTDREGRLVIEPGFADGLILIRVLAAGVEPLREFPIMPGESIDERVVPVDPLAKTVAIDTQLNALRDEIVDLVATRTRLEQRMKTRAEAGAWDDIPALLEEFRTHPGQAEYMARLNTIREEAAQEQAQSRRVILTRHARALIADTEALIVKYLDDGLVLGVEDAYQKAKRQAAQTPAQGATSGTRNTTPTP
jgi:hypothetical protein